MLQDIRDNSQGVIAKVIIGLIVAVFALFGVESIIGGFVTSPPIAEINGEEITEAQLQSSTQNLLLSLGGAVDSFDQDLLEQIALGQIVEEVVLRQSAESAAMSISEDRLDLAIVTNPNFQLNGQFDPDLAVRTMVSQGFTVQNYRDSLRQQLLLSQLASAYSSSNFVTAPELDRVAELTAQTRDFRYISIPMGTRTLGTPISDEEIQSYYEAQQADFTEEEMVSVRYVILDKNVISEEIDVDEAELLAIYEEERGSFEGAAEKRASHILFEVIGDTTEEVALQQANNALQRLRAGEEFTALAAELSTDTVSGEEGGDIGYTNGTAFPESLEEALEILALNEVSDPVVSEFGVHLVMLTEDSEAAFQSFEEVRGRIERDLKSSEIELTYAERLGDLSNLAFETGELDTLATELNLVILQGQPFPRSGASGIFSNPAVVSAAFSDEVLLEGNNSDVIELNDAQAVVIHLAEYFESSVLPLEEVEPEIAVLIRTDMERDAVQTLGENLLSNIEDVEQLQTLLTENELEWIEEQGIRRDSLLVNQQIIADAFAMPTPEAGNEEVSSLTLENGTYVLVSLQNVTVGTLDSMPEIERDAITNQMLTDLGNNDFQAFMANLQESADIETRTPPEDIF
jgi:peptidyl-prolyl cis-trans isomerase D